MFFIVIEISENTLDRRRKQKKLEVVYEKSIKKVSDIGHLILEFLNDALIVIAFGHGSSDLFIGLEPFISDGVSRGGIGFCLIGGKLFLEAELIAYGLGF